MKGLRAVQTALVALSLAAAGSASAQINLQSGETYSQDFNTLPSTGTSNAIGTLPAGWTFVESGSGANTTYRAVDGSSNAGDTLSLGAASGPTVSERALGSLRSGSVASIFGARFRNDNPGPLASIAVGYVGEQWRQGTANRCDYLRFEYSIDATSLTTGTWIPVSGLDFESPACGAIVTNALNGNSPENQRFVARVIDNPGVAAGGEFWIRWVDTDAANADDALAVDDVAVTAIAGPAPSPVVSFSAEPVSANEGAVGESNPLDFSINVSPAPTAAQSVSFSIAVTGDAGRFTYAGPATVTVTSATPLPIVLSAATVGNAAVEGDSIVTMTLSNFTGVDASQTTPISKQGTIVEDDQPELPVVSFADGVVSVIEGDEGSNNALQFALNLSSPPAAGSPLSFDIAVSGPSGRFEYLGPSTLQIDSQTPLPYVIAVRAVGNRVDEPDAEVTVSLSNFVGADETQTSPLAKAGTILDDDLPFTEIFDIQGTGLCSPFASPCSPPDIVNGSPVRTASNVVTSINATGFTMQTPDARADADVLTSNGIAVFTSVAPRNDDGELLSIGDLVEVTGRAGEFRSMTQIAVTSTRDSANSIVTEATNQPLPAAIVFGDAPTRGSAPIPSKDPGNLSCGAVGNFECFEGMRVRIADGIVSVSHQRRASDLYAEVWISPYGERGFREKGVLFGGATTPTNAAAGVWDGNPEILEMDADFANTALAGTELAGGVRFSAEGILGVDFFDYEFWPTSMTIEPGSDQLVRPVPVAATGELTIGSFNAFRLCDSVRDNPAPSTIFCSANLAMETDENRVTHERGQVSAYIREVLRSPDVVGLQEVENIGILQALATKIAEDGGPTYSAHLVEGNDVGGIDVGYLVNTARVANITVTQLADAETWNDPGGSATATLHDRPPLLLAAEFVGNGRPFRFHVINNHTRSRGGVDVSNTAGERLRAKRFLQAVSIANLVQNLQSDVATAGIPLFVIGDHNAFQFTDGYVDVVGLVAGTYSNDENTCAPANTVTNCKLEGGANVVSPPLINALDVIDAGERYSYKFTENFGAVQGSTDRDVASVQVLDHGLFNSVAAPFVTGMAYGRANVDASDDRFRSCRYFISTFPGNATLSYNAERCGIALPSFSPVGSSDHDGFVIFVSPPLPDAIFANGFETID